MSDQAQLQRIAQTHGLGEFLFDEETDPDELSDMLMDLGVPGAASGYEN